MRRDHLPLVTLDGRHAGELLAHPCGCGRPRCTLGEHIWQSTRDMTPGPQAQSYEPRATTTPNGSDDDPPPDHTLAVDLEYTQAVQTYWDAARTLTRLIDRHRPDRWTPLPDPASDDQWCRHHLETIGQCESRFKGDECRMCNELRRTYGHLPDADLMRTRHQLGYLPGRAVHDWLQRLPRARKRKARKAS